MAFGSFGHKPNSTPMTEINMVPLIDVMLVLLVIFIITAPLLTNSVKINLPQASSAPTQTEPRKIDFAINDQGQIFWDGEPVTMDQATARLVEAGQQTPTPELHVRADRDTRYQVLAEVMAAASRAGVSKLGFVSEPVAR
ncbi:outer membrane transport energization protein ExbD (TC 2.C.1.1.1) [Hydrocarboniphaga daqingensis]|jgi:biopolymer transport protein ExbD|uniref:Outer membrane transport energization protein ExbD (TC 2.C.1.1.1) n=1 Tax=Hydrocarboniphaga daqingensis TaxID=490188 RepID=A0A1M5KAF8_9GAMM|nr:biopolymer transporter ExbD [Hydrocarboniphaga daqingensis]SHG49681.1 outer membrane transport energization protein ExbD (TC 2.C.1.1.1) [Hydrocarboniphaga daqingensis]